MWLSQRGTVSGLTHVIVLPFHRLTIAIWHIAYGVSNHGFVSTLKFVGIVHWLIQMVRVIEQLRLSAIGCEQHCELGFIHVLAYILNIDATALKPMD